MDKKNRNLKLMYMSVGLVFFAFTILTWTAFTEMPEAIFLILAIASTLIFLFSWFMTWVCNKGYKLKYLLFTRSLKEQMAKSLTKFNTTDKDFIAEFKKRAKEKYKYWGNIYMITNIPQINIDDLEFLDNAISVYDELVQCVKNKSGLADVFEKLEQLPLTNKQKYFCVVHNLLTNDMIYYFMRLYELTMFTFHDNELCDEFTKINEKNKETVKNVYDPILYNFEEELESILTKLKSYR